MPPERVKVSLEQASSDNNKAVEILLGENGKINITSFFIIAKQKCTRIILATASAPIILKE